MLNLLILEYTQHEPIPLPLLLLYVIKAQLQSNFFNATLVGFTY